jgi:hypothetical protein
MEQIINPARNGTWRLQRALDVCRRGQDGRNGNRVQNGKRRAWRSKWRPGKAAGAASGAAGEAGDSPEKQAALQGWRIKTEPNAMDCLQVDLGVGFKVFSEFGDEYVHASAEEIVILTPDV